MYFLYTELSHLEDVDIRSVYMAMSALKSCGYGILCALFLDSSKLLFYSEYWTMARVHKISKNVEAT
jgi:hypothetical protein